jgi:ABC-type dipeptide/oligopeptide/nickel transport system ATPase subunit
MSLLGVTELSKSFESRVLDGVSFSVSAGECVAILGKSGCGKSTLARCIAGLEIVTSGSVEIEGRAHTPHHRADRRRVQMVWQDSASSLSPFFSIRESMQEGLADGGRENLRALAVAVGLREELLDRRPHQLSGGELQRAGIARALAAEPKVLILDEPLSALDPITQFEILPYLRQATHAPNRAALFISHDLTAVRQLADRVLFLHGGHVVEDRPAVEFLTEPHHAAAREFVSAWPSLPF